MYGFLEFKFQTNVSDSVIHGFSYRPLKAFPGSLCCFFFKGVTASEQIFTVKTGLRFFLNEKFRKSGESEEEQRLQKRLCG